MKEKKPCELCNDLANVYCESDQANLCWDCDSGVHGANFLAAKHPRILLCRSCQSPTPWNASGPRLAPIVSVCQKCVDRRGCGDQGDSTQSSYGEGGGDESDCDGHRDGGAVADVDGDEEKQVVPPAVAPPVVTSPSPSEDSTASDPIARGISGKPSPEEPELRPAWGSTSNWKKYRVLIK